eukprot:6214820-Pleurochrysis_carterae.AAC.4
MEASLCACTEWVSSLLLLQAPWGVRAQCQGALQTAPSPCERLSIPPCPCTPPSHCLPSTTPPPLHPTSYPPSPSNPPLLPSEPWNRPLPHPYRPLPLTKPLHHRRRARTVRDDGGVEPSVLCAKVDRLQPRKRDADLEVELLPRVHRARRARIRNARMRERSPERLRANRRESRAKHALLARFGQKVGDCMHHLEADVLALTVAVEPQHERDAPTRLLLQVVHLHKTDTSVERVMDQRGTEATKELKQQKSESNKGTKACRGSQHVNYSKKQHARKIETCTTREKCPGFHLLTPTA